MNSRSIIFSFIIMLLLSSMAYSATTGRMVGSVLDNEGIPLPGVTVSITSDKLIGGPQIAITSVDGGFVFNLLPVGLYRVEANLPGFQPAAADIRVALDRVASITFNMVSEQFGAEIEVTAQIPIVDTSQVNSSIVFDNDYLQRAAVGSAGRDYLSIISQVAGVAGGGNASVMGSTNSDNSYLVDGLNTSDPTLGTFGTNFNYDAIEEMSFQTGGFEAEFGQATGGIINLVTKSGGNNFSGSFDVRYRDESFIENGDHFDSDEQTSELRNLSATFGGPIIRDTMWFFTSIENVYTSRQNEGASFPREYEGWNYIAKATWQVSDSNRLVIKYSGDPAEIPGRNSGQFVAPTGSLTTEQGGDNYQIELNSVLSESVLLNASIGRADMFVSGNPTHGDINISGHVNEDTGITDLYQFAWDNPRGRDQANLSITYFADLAGSHELKSGIEFTDLYDENPFFRTGGGSFTDVVEPQGFTYQDINGDGFFNHSVIIQEPEETAREPVNSTGTTATLYLQDSWRPMSNLTIKPGIRFDNVQIMNHVDDKIADMDMWQPRFGIAWDLFGDAKHVVRGSWGRFMDPTALSIAGFASGVANIATTYNTLEYYCNSIGICDADQLPSSWDRFEWTNWQGQTYTLIDNVGTNVVDPAVTLDQAGYGTLQAPYAESMILAYETQIARETSLELTYVDKKTKDIIEDTCDNNSWAWGDGEMPNLEDPSTWTTGAGCTRFVVANMPNFQRKYEALILKFETRQENFHLLASLTHSESTGNTENGADDTYAGILADFYPLHFYNRQGYLTDHRDNRLKVSGYWLLPYSFTIGFDGFYSSAGHITPQTRCANYVGARQEVLDYYGYDDSLEPYCSSGDGFALDNGNNDLFLEPRGSFETKSVWNLDLQTSKSFQVAKMDMTLIFAIYNIFGREMDNTFNNVAFRVTTEGNGDAVYDSNGDLIDYYMPIGHPTSYRQPRRYELGFRIEF